MRGNQKIGVVIPALNEEHAIAEVIGEIPDWVDLKNSAHSATYEKRIASWEKNSPSLLKLGPEAVLVKLVHALESRWPKPHYYVTLPTHALVLARRVLPTRLLDLLMVNE